MLQLSPEKIEHKHTDESENTSLGQFINKKWVIVPISRSGVITLLEDNKWEGNEPSLELGVKIVVEYLRQKSKDALHK